MYVYLCKVIRQRISPESKLEREKKREKLLYFQ